MQRLMRILNWRNRRKERPTFEDRNFGTDEIAGEIREHSVGLAWKEGGAFGPLTTPGVHPHSRTTLTRETRVRAPTAFSSLSCLPLPPQHTDSLPAGEVYSCRVAAPPSNQ